MNAKLILLLMLFLLVPVCSLKAEPGTLAPKSATSRQIEVLFRTGVLVNTDPNGELKVGNFEWQPRPGLLVEMGIDSNDSSPRYFESPVLASGLSDEDGFVRAKLTVPAKFKGKKTARVWGRNAQPGFMATVTETFVRDGLDDSRCWIAAREGATIKGVVLNGSGEPVANAGLFRVFRRGSALSLLENEKSDSRGRFAVDLGTRALIQIHARHPDFGSATSAALELETLNLAAQLQLTLGGGAEVSGVVRDPDGVPVPGLRILAVPKGRAQNAKGNDFVLRELGNGLDGSHASTGRDGSYSIPALLAGSYDLYGGWSKERPGANVLGMTKPERTHLGEIEVGHKATTKDLLFQAYRVEVRVVDAAGQPVDIQARLGLEWSEENHVGLLPLYEGKVPMDPFGIRPSIVEDLAIFPVKPGRSYLLVWKNKLIPFEEQRVTIIPQRDCHPITLRLHDNSQLAKLRIQVGGPQGEYVDDARVQVLSAASGYVAKEYSNYLFDDYDTSRDTEDSGGTEYSAELWPGDYEVMVDSHPTFFCMVPFPFPRPQFASNRQVITLKPGENALLKMRLAPAGHLDFESIVEGLHPTHAELEEIFGVTPSRYRDHIFQWLNEPGRYQASLHSQDGTVLNDLLFELKPAAAPSTPQMEPGWDARCFEPIPPGRWTFRLVAEARVVYEAEVQINAGEITTLRW